MSSAYAAFFISQNMKGVINLIQNSSTFRNILIKEANLLSLSKSDCDLFIIAQANTITYQQLFNSGIHGVTLTGGRLSLKKLLDNGYVTDKVLPNSRKKFFVLTFKGRLRLEKIFGNAFLSDLRLDLERKPPTSQQQLPHRIHTNDLYFFYISCPLLNRLPVWQLEVRYQSNLNKLQQPRCDGFLDTGHCHYYIEQDNCTQGDSALENKITQYMSSELFTSKNILTNTLIFTILTDLKAPPAKKSPYSVYRILLKAIRIWKMLEQETGCSLCFREFCRKFNNDTSLCLCLLSSNERNILRNLCRQHPDISLDEAAVMKQEYLYDTSFLEEQLIVKEGYFVKRLRQHFYKLLDDRSCATLQHRLRQGMHLYVLPNHNLLSNVPFLFQREYCLERWFPQILYHMGILNLEAWQYHPSLFLTGKNDSRFFFYNLFIFNESVRSIIIFEDIVHDLGGRERVRFFLRKNDTDVIDTVLFILLVSCREDAIFFTEETEKLCEKNKSVLICFLDKSTASFQSPFHANAYFKEKTAKEALWLPALIDHDDFTGELRLIERKDRN